MSVLTGFHNLARAYRLPNLRSMYMVSFLMGFGYNFFVQFFSVFLIARFQFSTTEIGALFAYVGIWMALTQGVLTRYLARMARPAAVLRWALLAAVALLIVLAQVEKVPTVYIL